MQTRTLLFASLPIAFFVSWSAACSSSDSGNEATDSPAAAGVGGSTSLGGSTSAGGQVGVSGHGGTAAAAGHGGGGKGTAGAAAGLGGSGPAGGKGGTATGAGGNTPGAGGNTPGAGGNTPGAGGTGNTPGAGGSNSAGMTQGPGAGGSGGGAGGISGDLVSPGDPGAHDVLFTIDGTKNVHAISPYVYGVNDADFANHKGLTMSRVGGNRLTAYNWETNASNAGSDYMFENDSFISSSNVAGDPMKSAVKAATDAGASIIMTVPIAGWVSKDESGPCNSKPSGDAEIATRFLPIANKGSGFAYPPDTTDGKVYEDEFVAYLESQFPSAQTDPARRIFYMLDNEPDLWSSTHSEIHPAAVTYAELTQKNAEFAKAIKNVAPSAIVFGPVNYGWAGYANLQSAPDASGDWLEFYLDAMKKAEGDAGGKRLVDVLDVHWYPEAQGDGHRIVDEGTSPGEVEARLQAPRSLWDSTYVETSWITGCCTNGGAINLIPRLQGKIDAHYPGTKLSISEYNYGAGADISGGVAEADALGIFGRDSVYAAALWPLSSDESFVMGGFDLYRDYDGNGSTFGDLSIGATTSDIVKSSVYASYVGDKVIVVAVNKDPGDVVAGIELTFSKLTKADVYALTSAGPKPVKGAGLTAVAANAFSYKMPGHSATTIVFSP